MTDTPPTPDVAQVLGHRNASTVNSENRQRAVRAVGANTAIDIIARTEARYELLDSHTDTCVARSNILIDGFTDKHCDVTPYSIECEPITDVLIVNALTASMSSDMGKTFILRLFKQLLWHGKKIQMSLILINSNLMQHHGLGAFDNPTDSLRSQG